MNQTAIVSLRVLCHLSCLQAPYSNDANIVVSNPPAISNQSPPPPPPPVQPATLPDGYIAYPEIGAAYKIIFEKASWSDAREKCHLEGAHLGVIDSQRKIDYMRNTTYHTYYRTADYLYIHIGIYRMANKWVSVNTGTTLSDLPWISSYPDTGEDCTVARVSKTRCDDGLANPSYCSTKYAYICEVPIPEGYKTQEYQLAQVSVN